MSTPNTTTSRTSVDYAIEFGRYLATAAESFMGEQNRAVEAGEDPDADFCRALESAIYEFRKRADRAGQETALVRRFTPEQETARRPLIDAGNRILTLLYRVSDTATEEQKREAMSVHRSLCSIWNEALAEPLSKSPNDSHTAERQREINQGLREPGGALIGGLHALDYNKGHEDFAAGRPPPDSLTSTSYDLGRKRAGGKAERLAILHRLAGILSLREGHSS